MTGLEKIKALIAQNGYTVVCGYPEDNAQDNVVALTIAESLPTRHCFGDRVGADYPMIRIDVYCSDYLAGYNLLEEIKAKIDNAEKTTMKIVRVKDLGSTQNTALNKTVLSVLYKEII